MKPSLCLNMIVRNEGERILRCLASVAPYIKAYSILDTGSSDDTADKIIDFFHAQGIPGQVHHGEFRDFSQARNDAFRLAREHNGRKKIPWCQFALMVDADMELAVDDKTAFNGLDANAFSYDMMQKGGSLSYANRRLVNFQWPNPPYVGVTHEYIDVPAAGMIKGASFIDHADGSNRVNKYERDAKLLEAALKDDLKNGRSWYYLGNTYFDWGKFEKAERAYMQRIRLGGWDEETHSAMMRLAASCRDQGDVDGFVAGMIDAYNFRPSRAEPLHELAKHYREKGNNAAALMFAKTGIAKTRPDDVLFVDDFVYSHGLRYEYSIAGYYDPQERGRAFKVTDDLALDPACPAELRWSARNNLFHFTKPLKEHCPSFTAKRIEFTPPPGYTAMNPSIEECNGKLKCNIRCVNYTINEHGQYMIGEKGCGDAPIDTRNFVARLDTNLDVKDAAEIIWNRPLANFPQVTGLEDVRLYRSRGELWFSACVRECSPHGTCQQARGRLVWDPRDDRFQQVRDFEIMSEEGAHQKNWMPMPHDGAQDFIYRLDTIFHADAPQLGVTATVNPVKITCNDISGSSQLIPFKAGHLAVVHEAATGPDGKRTYWHRFAWSNHDYELRRLSLPFVFLERQIEFCAGLAYHPNGNELIISFGVRDAEAYLATVSIEDASAMCWKFHES